MMEHIWATSLQKTGLPFRDQFSPMVHHLLHTETSHLEEHALLAFATPLLCVHTSPAIISASLTSQSCYC